MYSWDVLATYLTNHPRWFESSTRTPITGEHLVVYRELVPAGNALRRRGQWLISEPPAVPLHRQGWKLHVSATADTSEATLRAALPVIRDAGVHFKFLADRGAVRAANDKLFPRGSSGKFITVYPPDLDSFHALARGLAEALRDFHGPYVLSDRRLPGSDVVFYRYGGFQAIVERQPDGVGRLMIETPDGTLRPDDRLPYYSAPDWVEDPFPAPESPAGGRDLDGGRFTITSALAFSNRGGLYRATDNTTGAEVVIKEARPFVAVGLSNVDAITLLEREHAVLCRLADTGSFVRPVRFFREWEHAFLAEEFVPGRHLGRLTLEANPIYDLDLRNERLREYLTRLVGLWRQVADAVDHAHRNGVVLGDLSLTNVMVTDDDRVVVIDLEAAVRDGVDEPVGLITPGMSDLNTGEGTRNDYHSLGAVMLGSLMLWPNGWAFDRSFATRALHLLATDLDLPPDLVAVITELMDGHAEELPAPEVIAKRLAALPLATHWQRPVPLASVPSGGAAWRAEIGERAERTVAGVRDYLLRVADLDRTDRLFPADLTVFETNPVSVAFGAAGVLHAMRTVGAEVPEPWTAWLLQRSTSHDALPAGLYYGQAGVAWVLAELGHDSLARSLLLAEPEHPLLWRRHGVLAGSAGYGMACLRVWRQTGDADLLHRAEYVAERLAAAATGAGAARCWLDERGGQPVGYGHGGSGIAMFLLALHAVTGDPAHLALGRAALDSDLACARTADGGLTAFPSRVDAADRPDPVLRQYWDEGTAGVLTTVLRYHAVTGDEELRGWIDRLLPDVRRSYAVFPQLFHGLAGIGAALLDGYEYLGDTALLDHACRAASVTMAFAVDRPEGTAFPGEQTIRESADFGTGAAGVATFLHRLTRARPGARTNANFLLDDLLESGQV